MIKYFKKELLQQYLDKHEYIPGRIIDRNQIYYHWNSDSYIVTCVTKDIFSSEDIFQLFSEFKGSELVPESELGRFLRFATNSPNR